MPPLPDADLAGAIRQTSTVVAAYVSRNSLPARELPALIDQVHSAFREIRAPSQADPKRPTSAEIAASFKKDHLVSFIDGKLYKTLKRHLTAHGLNPRSYRERYGLPADYPIVAPSYAKRRAALAKRAMFGEEAA